MTTPDILSRRKTSFVLWCPRAQVQPPKVVIGQLRAGNPPTFAPVSSTPLVADPTLLGLWSAPASSCSLVDGQIYHYWLEVDDSRSTQNPPARIAVTDPFAGSVDWRAFPPGAADATQPAGVTKFSNGKLTECDPNGETADLDADVPVTQLPPNNQIVIYELPTAWAISRSTDQPERATATFSDVTAMIDATVGGANFSELGMLAPGQSYLGSLGVNALELLPCADSFYKREWGYDTSHYLAPDAELGYPEGNLSPTANRDLAALVRSCHAAGIRFFIDAVMAFGKEDAYNHVDAQDFHIDDPSSAKGDPDAWTSFRSYGQQELRNGFGSTLWRYAKQVTTYDPVTGSNLQISPGAQLMLTYVTRWIDDFHVDGVRIDSVENVANWDFLGAFRTRARNLWAARWTAQGLGAGADSRFIVVGEELSLPFELLTKGILDGLWNEDFQARIRAAVLGESAPGEPTFEWTVKKAIDCRLRGFTDGAQAVNYITKHDVEGPRHERLFNMLRGDPNNSRPQDQIEKRIKLAFVCLLTSVGIPLILAGEEFADQHDLFGETGAVSQNGGKQIDPVNFSRLTPSDPTKSEDGFYALMRGRILAYVTTLIKLRTAEPALAMNDTDFIHQDFDDGKRVMAWRRGGAGALPVVVLANFSDFASPSGADYVVNNWPSPTPPGKKWVEITQGRVVDPAWVGREAIFPWEAKVYALR